MVELFLNLTIGSEIMDTTSIMLKELKVLNDVIKKNNVINENPIKIIVLDYLSKNKDGLSPSKLGNILSISRPLMTSILNSLENEKYITRTIDDRDKRMFILKITNSGIKFLDKAKKIRYQKIENLISRLGKTDTEELIRLIQKCTTILKGEE